MATYGFLHRLRHAVTEDVEFAGNMAFRIGTLYALVLSLAFSTTLSDFEETEEAVDDEIVAISTLLNLYRQLDRPEEVALLHEYTIEILEGGFHPANRGRPDSILDELQKRALTDMQASKLLAADAFNTIETVRMLRIQRIFDLRQGLPWFFWFFGVVGMIITISTMSVFKPNVFRMALAFGYGALAVLLMYMIHEMDTPYEGFYQLDPVGFQEMGSYLGMDFD